MQGSITRRAAAERAGLFGRRMLTYTISLHITFSEEELAAIEQKNLVHLPVFERPYHPKWGDVEQFLAIKFLPIGTLVHLHRTQETADVGYYRSEWEAEVGEVQLRKGLERLKDMIVNVRPLNREESFEF